MVSCCERTTQLGQNFSKFSEIPSSLTSLDSSVSALRCSIKAAIELPREFRVNVDIKKEYFSGRRGTSIVFKFRKLEEPMYTDKCIE